MKTLLVAPELFHSEGGISRILRLYLRALADIAGGGREVGYVALNDEAALTARAGEVVPGGPACAVGCDRGKLGFAWAVWRHGAGAGQIVCGHLHQLPVVWLLSWVRPSLRYVLVAHGIEVWRPYSWLERLSLRRATRIFCISEYTRRQMLRFDPGLDPARLIIVPNTFDPGFAGQGPANPALSSQLSAHSSPSAEAQSSRRDDGPVILTVARLTKADTYKGVDTVIEAMPRLLRALPRARLRIVGDGDDMERLQALAESLGLYSRQRTEDRGRRTEAELKAPGSQLQAGNSAVHFTGFIDDAALRAEYRGCDLFALPSRKEGFGLVYLEAMSGGKPCIAARAGGSPEVVDHEVGALVDYGNTDQIADAVAELWRRPPAVGKLRERAAHFSFANFQDRLCAALADARS